MKIKLITNKEQYTLMINQRFTIIQGLSAVRKTYVIKLLGRCVNIADTTAVLRVDDKKFDLNKIHVYPNGATDIDRIIELLETRNEDLFFFDEGSSFLHLHDIGKYLKDTNNYIVIISRDSKFPIGVSVGEIYTLDGRKNFKHLYAEDCEDLYKLGTLFDYIIPEDSVSGRKFLEDIFPDKKIIYKAKDGSSGNATFIQRINEFSTEASEGVLLIFDYAAFGFLWSDLQDCLSLKKHVNFYMLSWNPLSGILCHVVLLIIRSVDS